MLSKQQHSVHFTPHNAPLKANTRTTAHMSACQMQMMHVFTFLACLFNIQETREKKTSCFLYLSWYDINQQQNLLSVI